MKEVAQSEKNLQEFTQGHRQHVAFLMKYHCEHECVSREELQQLILPAQSLMESHSYQYLQLLLNPSAMLGVLVI